MPGLLDGGVVDRSDFEDDGHAKSSMQIPNRLNLISDEAEGGSSVALRQRNKNQMILNPISFSKPPNVLHPTHDHSCILTA
jgi:hypothetical protein